MMKELLRSEHDSIVILLIINIKRRIPGNSGGMRTRICCLLRLHSYGQYDPGATMMIAQNNMLYNNTIQSFVNQNIINDLAYANTTGKRSGTSVPGVAAPADAAAFLISPNSTTSVKVKQAIINRLKSRNPTAGRNLENALKQ